MLIKKSAKTLVLALQGRKPCHPGVGRGPYHESVICMSKRTYYVYIMTNKKYGTLYIGMTNNLIRRVEEHKQGLIKGFTQTHKLNKLVYFDYSNDVYLAIQRERNMKEWKRQWKIDLIEEENPLWEDLSKQLSNF